MKENLKRMGIITGVMIIIAMAGCASKGFVMEEIKKSRTETSAQIQEEVKPLKESSNIIFKALLETFRAERKRLQETIEALDKEIKELEGITSNPAETPQLKPGEAIPQSPKK